MSITGTLKVILLANGVPLAESEDPALWHRIFGQISGASQTLTRTAISDDDATESAGKVDQDDSERKVRAFAEEIGADYAKVVGACSPSGLQPYLHLDMHCWAAFRSNFPSTGRSAVSGIVLAATLLVLWRRHAKIERISTSDVKAVLETVGTEGAAVVRSIQRCSWLQFRDDQIRLNPAEITRAEAIARAFCLKQPELSAIE